MTTAPARVQHLKTPASARVRAEARWASQHPVNRRHRRQQRRRARVVEVQLLGIFLGALVFALTAPSWLGIVLIVAGYVLPALVGAWIDTYRPLGRLRRPLRNSLAITIHLDHGAAQ